MSFLSITLSISSLFSLRTPDAGSGNPSSCPDVKSGQTCSVRPVFYHTFYVFFTRDNVIVFVFFVFPCVFLSLSRGFPGLVVSTTQVSGSSLK